MARHKKPNGKVCHGLHAEQSVLRAAKPGDTLYVIRWRADGSIGLAKPCKQCQKEIERRKIRRVYYTTQDGNWEIL